MQTYLVGGAVRDQLLGLKVKDRDWVVIGASPEEMQAQGFRPVGQDFPVFLHPDTGEEYALARTERKSGKGYTGFQFHTSPDVSLEDDLRRRDLTINAIAQAADGTLHDPWHGRDDLEARLLRHVSPAFSEDPLRVLRVARFYARFATLGFRVAPETLALMHTLSASDELSHLTPERVWQETERALSTATPACYFQLLQQTGALATLFPLLANLDTDILAERLSGLPTTDDSSALALALLLYQATEQQSVDEASVTIRNFCLRLRVPNRMRDLAIKLRISAQALANFQHLNAEQRLQLLRQLDLLRRPDALPTLCLLTAHLEPLPDARLQALQRLLKRIAAIDTRTLMAQGFSGKALGDALAEQQRRLCEEYKEPPHE